MNTEFDHQPGGMPWGLVFGQLGRAAGPQVPAYLPVGQGGVVLAWEGEQAEQAGLKMLEQAVVGLLESLPAGLLQVHVLDFALRRRFAALSELAECYAYQIHHDAEAARKVLAETVRLATWRHHHLLGAELPTLADYLHKFEGREPWHVLIVNLADVARDGVVLELLEKLLDGGFEAGVILLIMGPAGTGGENDARLSALCRRLPCLQVREAPDGVCLGVEGDLPECAELAALIEDLGLDWTPPVADAQSRVRHWLAAARPAADAALQDFISVPIGTTPDGRHELCFALGPRTGCNHAFILGMNGSGKSTLLNNLILGIGERYSPRQVQLYLMDYKDGVEFQAFRDLPHCARIFLDNTDRAAATRLLEEFVATIGQRGALFRSEESNVADLEAYNARHPEAPLPRLVLIVDEAQELFSSNWKETQQFNELLKKVVKKGRAFGVHLILSTQTLLTSNIDREVMTQIQLRIALKLNNSGDCDRILSFGNDAPLYLKRFELVLNEDSGLKARNRPGRCAAPRDIKTAVAAIRAALPPELRQRPEIVTSARADDGDTQEARGQEPAVDLGELPAWAADPTAGPRQSKRVQDEDGEYARQRALLESVERARQKAQEGLADDGQREMAAS